jgi:hypothetical protein
MSASVPAWKSAMTETSSPVAISDKQIASSPSFTIQLFEICTICGARFGIGYRGVCVNHEESSVETDELPKKLVGILARDHRQNRAHKNFIDLAIFE